MILKDNTHLSDVSFNPIGVRKKTLKEAIRDYNEEQLINYIRKNYKKEDIWNE